MQVVYVLITLFFVWIIPVGLMLVLSYLFGFCFNFIGVRNDREHYRKVFNRNPTLDDVHYETLDDLVGWERCGVNGIKPNFENIIWVPGLGWIGMFGYICAGLLVVLWLCIGQHLRTFGYWLCIYIWKVIKFIYRYSFGLIFGRFRWIIDKIKNIEI